MYATPALAKLCAAIALFAALAVASILPNQHDAFAPGAADWMYASALGLPYIIAPAAPLAPMLAPTMPTLAACPEVML